MLNRHIGLVLALAVCLGSFGAFQAAPSAVPQQQGVYTPDRILEIDIRMEAEDWHEVRISHRDAGSPESDIADSSPYEYRRADITIDGVTIDSVGVRKKGFFGSVISTRPSLKIKFNEYVDDQAFEGVDRLTLNNNNQDPTFANQYIAYDLFARAGVPAPLVNFARVRVNGEDLGIYTNIEPIRKPFLERVFGNADGLLYESYAGDFVEDRLDRMVGKDRASEEERRPLEELTTLLASPDPVSLEEVGALVDLDSFLRLWATEVLMGHWDGYAGNRNNYYLYLHPTSNKFFFVPWGADRYLFEDPGPFITNTVPRSVKAVGILARRLWDLPAGRDLYRAEMARLLADHWDEARMTSDIARLQRILQPQSTRSAEFVEEATAPSLAFINARRAEIEAELTPPGPDWPSDLGATVGTEADEPAMTLTGTFTAPWTNTAPETAIGLGAAALTFEIEGEAPRTLDQGGAFALANRESLEGVAAIRQHYLVVNLQVLDGARVWAISLTIDPHQLTPETRELPIDHFTVWAIIADVDPADPDAVPNRRVFGVVGELRFDDVAPVEGGQIRGTFTLNTSAM